MSDLSNEKNILNSLKKYCNEVNKYYKAGNIESSYNKPVIDLIQSFECSAHDFSGARSGDTGENIDIKLWHKEEDINNIPPFGAIEVKKVGGKDERARKQIIIEAQKYGNVILTDNIVWEFYNDESEKMYNGFVLFEKDKSTGEFVINESKIELFISSINNFILKRPNSIKSSSKLAYYMAEYAKTIKTIVYNILKSDSSKPMYVELFALYSRLKEELLPDLEIKEFSDMYAQTIVYGLFIARYNDTSLDTFSKGEAIANLTKESHLLKQFFQHVATSDNLHPTLDNSINKLCELFALTDLKKLLDQYEKKDAIVHFYEDFLGYYDLKQKKQFGAYYTPVPIVDYMINFVDEMLIEEFNIEKGLANNETTSIIVKCDEYGKGKSLKNEKKIDVPKVAILDPACGTGTFGAEIIKYVKSKYFSNGNDIFYKKWLQDRNGLMSRLVCFEIMMTSYVIAHLKIRRTLSETLGGNQLDEGIRTNIFLTNTLAEPKSILERNTQISLFDFSGAITEEAEQADKWKCRRPLRVIIGNPPYLYSSKNEYDISGYRLETDGITKLSERNPKGLNDDYVKFIRFAEQHIQKEGQGILAFITNNGYLDNITFRGMRASLLRTFDKIYIINLHGNSLKKEISPDGSKDENVFDITIGVAIIIGIKTSKSKEWAKVKYASIYGTRKGKFETLNSKRFAFIDIRPDKTNARFIPQTTDGQNKYEKGISLLELFNVITTGIDSGNDNFAIARDKSNISEKMNIIQNAQSDNEIMHLINKLYSGQTIKKLKSDVDSNGEIIKLSYRPFETKYTYYTGISGGWLSRPRDKNITKCLNNIPNNYGMVFQKQGSACWGDIFVSKNMIDSHFIGSKAYIAPFIIDEDNLTNELVYNLNYESVKKLTCKIKNEYTYENVFDYIYGILHDLNYRKRNNDFLNKDYPRVPIPDNDSIFKRYYDYGSKLKKLHLNELNIQTELKIESNNENICIDNVKRENEIVKINNNTSIIGISNEVWNYKIGSYQLVEKWLKNHKGEDLSIDNFDLLKKIVAIVEETIILQNNF